MLPLFAMLPPPPIEARLVFCLVGAALGAVLARWFRGAFSFVRAVVAVPLAVLLFIGLDLVGVIDLRGDLAFLVGLVAGGLTASNRPADHRAKKGLVVAAMLAGPFLGLSLFAIVWWREGHDRSSQDLLFFMAALLAFGTVAGLFVAALIVWLNSQWLRGQPTQPTESSSRQPERSP